MAYSVNYESRFLDNPAHENIQDVKRTLRYLQENQSCGMNFDTLKIKAYSDSDYVGDVIDIKSTTGFVCGRCNCMVFEKAKYCSIIGN
jgi:hypothetical protein